jgi:large subunit ribosomal protein L31
MGSRRFLLAAALMCAAAASLLGSGATATAGAAARRAVLVHLDCRSTLDPTLRRVSVVSVMRPVPHTRSLSVRVSLLETLPGTAPTAVTDGDLGRWLTPADPTLGQRPADVWKLAKAVYGVAAPARYRFRVQFRWIGPDGRVLLRATRQTPSCAERELRPDLLVRHVGVQPLVHHPHRERYVAVVANRGLTATGPFSVLFTPGVTGAPQSAAVASLGPGQRVRVAFIGPVCDPTAPPSVVADPTDAVDDFDRSNNTLTVVCPGVADGASLREAGTRLEETMKTEIHPTYTETNVSCTCGNQFVTRSTKDAIHVEICSACHPFYTGRQKLVDTGGRVERFQRRVAKGRRTARQPAGVE